MSTAVAGRPKVDTLETISAMLASHEASCRSAEARLVELQSARTAALSDPAKTAKAIVGLETNIRETEIELERLTASRPGLQARLAEAEAAERWAEFEKANAAADAACAAYWGAVSAYEKAAKQIVAVCELCRAAEAAISEAMRTAFAVGAAPEFDLPRFTGGSLARTVVLPRPGEASGLFWGKLPPAAARVSPYAPVR